MSSPISRSVVAAAMAGLVLSPVAIAEQSGSAAIQFSGEQAWSVTCSFTKTNGKEKEIKRRGRGHQSIKSMAIRNISSGHCEADVPTDTALKITFTGGGDIACPFEAQDPCVTVLTADRQATFKF